MPSHITTRAQRLRARSKDKVNRYEKRPEKAEVKAARANKLWLKQVKTAYQEEEYKHELASLLGSRYLR